MTHLTVLQRLAEDAMSLRIRKWSLRRLIALEAAFYGVVSERQMIEGAMRHDPSNNGRGSVTSAPSSVRATTIQASPRTRVRDSHDARSAEDRGMLRPYSNHHFRKDVAQGSRDDGSCVSYRVPTWATELAEDERVKLASARVSFTPSRDEDARPNRKPRLVDARVAQRDKVRLIAGTIRMAEQD